MDKATLFLQYLNKKHFDIHLPLPNCFKQNTAKKALWRQ